MISVPNHIASLQAYKPGKAVKDIFEGKNLERTAILSSNENNFGVSPKAIAAINQILTKANTYPEPSSLDLRMKLAERLGKKPENLIIGNGSDGLLSIMFKTFFSEGDELLTSHGSFVAVSVMSHLNNVPTIKTPLRPDYSFDLEAMAKQIGERTKVIYLCNPNNPTGAMISRSELVDFLTIVPKNILVMIDEAYSDFSFQITDEFPDSTKLGFANTLTLRTFSKAYGLAGVRLGYGVAHESIIANLMKTKMVFDPSIVAQAAGMGALDDDVFVQMTVNRTIEGLEYYYQAFEKLGLKYFKGYGNFVMLDFETPERAQSIFQNLLERGVFVRPLTFFELPHCLRISVGTMEENELCIEKLGEVLSL